MGQGRAANPVIGYLLVDGAYRVLDPRGGRQDPAFATPAAARAAAARHGCAAAVARVEALHLAGLLRVLQDGGDIYLDGWRRNACSPSVGRRAWPWRTICALIPRWRMRSIAVAACWGGSGPAAPLASILIDTPPPGR